MAKYYQYILGENRGKVVSLKEIDDTMMDMILYVFDDGFRCNEDLIAPLNEWNIQGKIMAEVDSPSNIWKFKEKNITAQKMEAFAKDGTNYEIPDPYFTGKNGENLAKEKHEIIMEHPRKTNLKAITETLDNYYISNRYKKEDPIVIHNPIETGDPKKQISANPVEAVLPQQMPVKETHINFNDDIYLNLDLDNCINIIGKSESYSFTIRDIINALQPKSEARQITSSFENEATVLYNKCSKEAADVTLKIELDLPSFSLFKSIKENYPEGWDRMFIENVVNNIQIDDLKNKLIDSLIEQYNSQTKPLYD